MSHKITIPTLDLRLGMFVCDLDRPWIETPFLLQGFLIDDQAQIETLQQYCQQVTVDRSRCLGDAYAPRSRGRDAPRQPSRPLVEPTKDAEPKGFAAICRYLRAEPALRRQRITPKLNPPDQQSQLEAELLYSAPIVDDIKNTLKSVRDSIANGKPVSFDEIGRQISELARGVERNPEAMIWLTKLRSNSQYSYDHALDVSVHLMVFARFLGLSPTIVEQLGMAGLMQDIGKIDIPAEILEKPGDLTDDEYQRVQSHVASSLEMLIGQDLFPSTVLEIIASHHERADGSGYPRRLNGERLPFHGELSGLVDSYCAMTRDRAYGNAISTQRALEELIRMRGTKFREPVVDQFIQCIGLYPIGSLVELNSGEVGVVIQQNKVRRLKPRLMILLGPDKSIETNPITIDLMMEPPTPTGEPYRIMKALPANAYGIDPSEFYLA